MGEKGMTRSPTGSSWGASEQYRATSSPRRTPPLEPEACRYSPATLSDAPPRNAVALYPASQSTWNRDAVVGLVTQHVVDDDQQTVRDGDDRFLLADASC